MIVVDTCILSSLSKIQRIDILPEFDEVCTTSAVINELLESENEEIVQPLSKALRHWLQVMNPIDHVRASHIHRSFPRLSLVDCELLLVCLENDCILFSDDRRLLSVAEREYDIDTYDLFEVVKALKAAKVVSKKDIQNMIIGLEKKDRYRFSSKREKVLLR